MLIPPTNLLMLSKDMHVNELIKELAVLKLRIAKPTHHVHILYRDPILVRECDAMGSTEISTRNDMIRAGTLVMTEPILG